MFVRTTKTAFHGVIDHKLKSNWVTEEKNPLEHKLGIGLQYILQIESEIGWRF